MSLRERAAQARLQKPLEAAGEVFLSECHRDVESPRPPRRGVWATAGVVVFQTRANVRSQADVMRRRIANAPKNVDEPLRLHVMAPGKSATIGNTRIFVDLV